MYTVGQEVLARVTNIKSYGFFVNFDDMNGLVHISEISDSFIASIHRIVSVNEIVKLKIVEIRDDRIFLSFKETHPRYSAANRTLLTENEVHSKLVKHFTDKEVQKYQIIEKKENSNVKH